MKNPEIRELVIAGWTGRDEAALKKHIRELEGADVVAIEQHASGRREGEGAEEDHDAPDGAAGSFVIAMRSSTTRWNSFHGASRKLWLRTMNEAPA